MSQYTVNAKPPTVKNATGAGYTHLFVAVTAVGANY